MPVETAERVEVIKHEVIFVIPGLERHFNAGAWRGSDGNTVLLARYAKESSDEGKPDIGSMVITTLEEVKTDLSRVLSRKEVWNPQNKDSLIEDARSIVLSDQRVLIGLTSVEQAPNADWIPYPAFHYLTSTDEIPEITRPFRVVKEFGPGKNMTPLDSETFLFRQEGEENNHKLLVVKWNETENTVLPDGVLEFPTDLNWASYRTGTAMPPIWVNDEEALMIFHGIRIDADDRYIYSAGLAKLIRDHGKLRIEDVYKYPILQPDDFNSINQDPISELHSNRRVVYICGGVIEQVQGVKKLVVFPNKGDIRTYGARYDVQNLMSPFRWKDSSRYNLAL